MSEKEIKRLREAGVHELVVHDSMTQILFQNLGWTRQEKVLFAKDWLLENYFKMEAKRQIFHNLVKNNQCKFEKLTLIDLKRPQVNSTDRSSRKPLKTAVAG